VIRLRRVVRRLCIALALIVGVALALALIVVGLLALKERGIQEDVIVARLVVESGAPRGSSITYTLAFLDAHPTLTLPHHHFAQQYINLPFHHTSGYDTTDPNSQAYPQGKVLLAGWTNAREDTALLDVVFLFDIHGHLMRSILKEATIDLP